MTPSTDILLCYRGRFQGYVGALARALRAHGLRVAYDREILAGDPGFDPQAEVDWVSLGDLPQHDNAWRAPLRAAVDGAEMVAFALDFHDPSENVTNEIRWAIQSKAHAFFLIHAGPTTPESQGIIIGTIATNYLLTTGDPTYPEFGYHFCGALDGDDLQPEVAVAAHRIVAHRERWLAGPLPELSADNDLTLSDLEQRPEPRARRFLQALQQASAAGRLPPAALAGQASPFDATRQYLQQRETHASQAAPSERQIDRFRRADDILARSQPGPHELANYFGPLVLQAACVEAMIHDDLRRAKPPALDFRPAVVIGTLRFTNLVQPCAAVAREGCRVLLIDAAFVDFLYQLLKVSVSSAKATLLEGGSIVQLDFAAVPEQLALRPELIEGFHRCVRGYACEGVAGSSTDAAPALAIQQPLGTYLRLAERCLVGLAYAELGLAGAPWPLPALDIQVDPNGAAPDQRQTLLDLTALDYCVRSRRLIDGADVLDAVTAVLFLHCAVHIRQQMVATLNPASGRWAGESAAQFSERLQRVLNYVSKQMTQGGAPAAFVQQSLDQAWAAGTTPLRLWAAVEPRLRAEGVKGLKALRVWSQQH